MQEKLAITIILISLALFALIFVLYRIVNENSERYNKIVLSQRQQEYASRTIPYRRGDIVDRNGTYLATSEKVYNLILDPSQIMDKPDYYLEPTIQALVDVFGFENRCNKWNWIGIIWSIWGGATAPTPNRPSFFVVKSLFPL